MSRLPRIEGARLVRALERLGTLKAILDEAGVSVSELLEAL